MAEKNEVDPNLIVAFVFVGLATGGLPLLVAYIVGWIVFPLRGGKDAEARRTGTTSVSNDPDRAYLG